MTTYTLNHRLAQACRALVPVALALLFGLSGHQGTAAVPESRLPRLSLGVLQFGTAHWELEHMRRQGLDRAHGYQLDLQLMANLSASRLAVTSGSAHGAVADLLWVQARYGSGSPYLYLPFSSRIGEIVVPRDSDIRGVADLQGKRIGVAGGPDAKGWILLQRVAANQGIDLVGSVQVQYAAPPLLNQALKRGQLDAVVTYWHFAARLRGEGSVRSAFAISDLLQALELDDNLPVLGYVFPAPWARQNRDLLDRFAASLAETKHQLASQPDYWVPLRPLMNAEDDTVFQELRAGFVEGTPKPLTDARVADLQRLLDMTGKAGGQPMAAELFYRALP